MTDGLLKSASQQLANGGDNWQEKNVLGKGPFDEMNWFSWNPQRAECSWHTLRWSPLSAMVSRSQAVHSTTTSSHQDQGDICTATATTACGINPANKSTTNNNMRKLWLQNLSGSTGTLEHSTPWLALQGMRCTPSRHLVTRLESSMILRCNDTGF